MVKHQFHVGDYVVFGLTILISIGIGVFYAVSGGRQRTTSEYLVGGRKMTFFPVAISLMVSFESSIMMLGLPAEAYVYGLQWIWWGVGALVAHLLSIHLIVPLLHPLKLTSCYEYLEYRYKSKAVRLLGTFLGILSYVWYMGIVLFGPAVALEAVTGFPLWSSIFVISFVSVVYTAIGGLKAVIWTDVFQAFVMFMGIFSILIKGTIDVGGPKQVWDIAEAGGRMNFFNFSPDPRVRHTFWNLFIGSMIRGFGLGFNQSTIQRISSTRSVGEAKRMLGLVAPCFFLSLSIASYEGAVAYAYYQTIQCDPLESKQLTNPNQIIPFVVMDIFAKAPGMPGLFLASLFSASLSTLSSGLSSLSALFWADIVRPCVGEISEFKATLIAKISVVMFGLMACGIAILVAQIGGTLTQLAGSLISAFAGPLTGIFFLGCFFPSSNAKGTVVAGILSLVLCSWISMGMNFSPAIKPTPWLPPASTDRCDVSVNMTQSENVTAMYEVVNHTTHTSVLTTIMAEPERVPVGIENLYTLSYQWLSVVGIFSTIIIGLIVSFLTGANKPGDVDPRYIISMSDTLLICLPKRFRKFLSSFGPQFMDNKYKERFPDPSKKIHFDDYEQEVSAVINMSPLDQPEVNDDVKKEHGSNNNISTMANSNNITMSNNSTGQPTNNTEQLTNNTGQPTNNIGQPTNNIGQPTNNTGQPTNNTGQPTDNTGQPTNNTEQSTDNTGQSTDNTGQSTDNTGQSTDNTGQSTDNTEQSTDNTGQPTNHPEMPGNSTGQLDNNTGQESKVDNVLPNETNKG